MDTPVLSLKDITKIYTSGTHEYQALKGISFDIAKGEFVAIMGPSGSGKSTTMHIMGALDIPTSGTYMLNGTDISTLHDDELARIRNKEIGFVFQSFNLLSRTTVYKNVERPMLYSKIASNERHERVMNALGKVGLSDKADNLSNQISGGQIQRVAIARALIMNPSIILADEPTGNLDTKTSYEIMSFLTELNQQGHTIVLITHEHDIANFSKRIIWLRDGEVLSDEVTVQKESNE